MFRSMAILFITFLVSGSLLAQGTGYQPPSETDVATGNLTDEEKMMMDNYTHAAYQKREADEAWAKECGTSDECNNIRMGGDATDGEKFMGMSASMFKAVGKAYSMVMPALSMSGKGGGIERTTKDDVESRWSDRGFKKGDDGKFTADTESAEYKKFSEGKSPEELSEAPENANKEHSEAEEEEGNDYCQYIPMGTEIIATAKQKSSSEFALATSPPVENSQSAALFKQARAHKDRKESVDIQRKGWTATTACYTVVMASGGAAGLGFTQGRWKNWAKLGASALMSKYYDWEYGMHDDAADKLNRVAKKLSGKGACNPISDRDCYCSQPETENDVKYCFPQIRQKQAQANNYQVVCVDNNVKEDLNCTCRQTNTCLDNRIQAKIDGMYVPGGIGGSLSEFYKLSNGVSTPGDRSDAFKSSSGKVFATANDTLKNTLDKINLPDSYKKKDKEVGKELMRLGFNGAVAGAISATPDTKASKEAEKKLTSRRFRGGKYASKSKPYYNKNSRVYFKGGKGLNGKKKSNKKAVNPYAHLMKKKKKRGSSKSEILNFSQKAAANAGITKDKSRNIFEIISRRYRYSATKKLGLQ